MVLYILYLITSSIFCSALGNKQAVISKEECHNKEKRQGSRSSIFSFGDFLQRSHSFSGSQKKSESHIMTFGEFLQHSHSYTGSPTNSTHAFSLFHDKE